MQKLTSVVLLVTFAGLISAACVDPSARTYDGSCNNLLQETWGKAGQFFAQKEGYKNVQGLNLPNERKISNLVLAYPDGKLDKDYNAAERRTGMLPDEDSRNAFFVAFSQIVAHDLSHSPTVFSRNPAIDYGVQIEDPTDPLYQPWLNNKTGILTMRSTGAIVDGIYHSHNNASNWLDLSTVYGSSADVNNKLRSHQGGRLLTDESGQGLPFATVTNVPNECGTFRPGVSSAGDLRPDENGVLTSIHTMFLRVHNIFADEIAALNPGWTDEQVFQATRNKLIAKYQAIVFYEFLPTLLGPAANRYRRYSGYDDSIDPSITNAFATAAFRVVHDMVPLPALVLNSTCGFIPPITTSDVPTQEALNCIPLWFREVGLDSALRGSLAQFAQARDRLTVNGLRNVFLQASSVGGNMDIETTNIFRGRDHGVPDFNRLHEFWTGRSFYDFPLCNEGVEEDSIRCFKRLTNNETLAAILKDLYKKVNRVDAYVGLLCESKTRNGDLPVVATSIILDQFDRLRHGDRWYFENQDNGLFTRQEIRQLKNTQISELLRLAYPTVTINDDAFFVHNHCNL